MLLELAQIAQEDLNQKTWIPEGTEEYKAFKLITLENFWLIEFIRKHFPLSAKDLVLDVGGRDGQISFAVQNPASVHLVDPDPTLELSTSPSVFWRQKIQDVAFESDAHYKLIVCSHVLGYLGRQEVQDSVVHRLVEMLEEEGTLLLFYNTNYGYMSELLDLSKQVLEAGHHYDYFDESILKVYRGSDCFDVKQFDVSFLLHQQNFMELARSCWFLFGAINPDIEASARKFLPQLTADLFAPSFVVDERLMIIKRLGTRQSKGLRL